MALQHESVCGRKKQCFFSSLNVKPSAHAITSSIMLVYNIASRLLGFIHTPTKSSSPYPGEVVEFPLSILVYTSKKRHIYSCMHMCAQCPSITSKKNIQSNDGKLKIENVELPHLFKKLWLARWTFFDSH
jgi:hypothetical protein